MNAFSNQCKVTDYKPITKLSNGKYLVCFDKVEILYNETTLVNSKVVNTGKKLHTGDCTFRSFIIDDNSSTNLIVNEINKIIDEETAYNIINSCLWNGYNIYLSKENQMNYKNAFDLAVTTNGESLPVTFKFKKKGKSTYYTFDTVAELKDFYLKINKHINDCLALGWSRKDKVNPEDYNI